MSGGRARRLENLQALRELCGKQNWTLKTMDLDTKLELACAPFILDPKTVRSYIKVIRDVLTYESRTGKQAADLRTGSLV